MKLLLLEAILKDIESHALSAYPEECCGLLIGALPENFGDSDCEISVAQIRRLANAWNERDKTRRYLADPQALAQVEKEYRGTGEGIVGIYHSHPDAPARPSAFDLSHAWPAYAYLIASVRNAQVAEARVFSLSKDARSFEKGKLKTWRSP